MGVLAPLTTAHRGREATTVARLLHDNEEDVSQADAASPLPRTGSRPSSLIGS